MRLTETSEIRLFLHVLIFLGSSSTWSVFLASIVFLHGLAFIKINILPEELQRLVVFNVQTEQHGFMVLLTLENQLVVYEDGNIVGNASRTGESRRKPKTPFLEIFKRKRFEEKKRGNQTARPGCRQSTKAIIKYSWMPAALRLVEFRVLGHPLVNLNIGVF